MIPGSKFTSDMEILVLHCTKMHQFLDNIAIGELLQLVSFQFHFQKISKGNLYLICIEAAFPCKCMIVIPQALISPVVTDQSIWHRPDSCPNTAVVITAVSHYGVQNFCIWLRETSLYLCKGTFLIKVTSNSFTLFQLLLWWKKTANILKTNTPTFCKNNYIWNNDLSRVCFNSLNLL